MKSNPHSLLPALAACLLITAAPSAVQAQAPGVISYQGRITNNGANFTGTGQFRFVIYRAAPAATLWSHDGTSAAGGMTAGIVQIPVTNGLFSVGMGDIAVPGMVLPIPSAIFSTAGLRMRIWFSDGVQPAALIADHSITSTGYAMFAQTVADGSISSGKIANGAVTTTHLAANFALPQLRFEDGGMQTALLDASTGAGQGALFTLSNGLGNSTVSLDADTTGDRGSSFTLFNSAGFGTVALNSDNIGESATLALRTEGNVETVQMLASIGGGEGAVFNLRNGLGATTLTLDADEGGRAGVFSVYNSTGQRTVVLDGDEGTGIGGRIQVNNNAGVQRAELDGQGASGGGELSLSDADNTATVSLRAAEASDSGARLEMREADGTLTVAIDAEGSTGGSGISLYKGNGVRTIYFDADEGGDGKISTQVLEITGGSDFSENFDIQSAGTVPGMVVSIDAAHPGELMISDRPYDRTVAGVVSGAGGVKPGLMMGQRGTAADGQHPVALTGRVYCYVDADRGAITPGDLITTSATPGHGMKAADHAQAQGAIIGKAMTGLRSGRGLVLLLVNLQ